MPRPHRLKPVPIENRPAVEALQSMLTPENLDRFFGLDPESRSYRVFHGTIEPRLAAIAATGMKAFPEPGQKEPCIYGTVSPTMALWHAAENRPHDTLRKQGKIAAAETLGKPVLLVLILEKRWVSAQPDSARPLSLPAWIKDELKISLDKDNRLAGFVNELTNEVDHAKAGEEADDFGIILPVDTLPPEYIFVQQENGDFQPIRDYVRERRLETAPN